MNTHISQAVLSAAALLLLPATSWSANPQSPAPADLPSSGSSLSAPAAMPGQDLSGIMMHNGSAYIVHRLQSDLSLPDGSTIKPNGTILNSSGSWNTLKPGEIFSLDGQSKPAPFLSPLGGGSLLSPASGVESLGIPLPDSGTPNPVGTAMPRSATFPGVSDMPNAGGTRPTDATDHDDFSD